MNRAIVVAAGAGRRFKNKTGKQFIDLLGRPLLSYSIACLEHCRSVDSITIVTNEESIEICRRDVVDKFHFAKVDSIIAGGKSRQDSVYLGLMSLDKTTEKVIIHDGARPNVTVKKIEAVIEAATADNGAILAVPVTDTIKLAGKMDVIASTLVREGLWAAQTPQVFDYHVLIDAYALAVSDDYQGTDDSSLVERLGRPVKLVFGDYENLKVTTPGDLSIISAIMKEKESVV